MRLAVLTSVEPRHRYVVARLSSAFDVVAVGHEETGYSPAVIDASDLETAERRLVAHHFTERTRQEESYFGSLIRDLDQAPSRGRRWIVPGSLNSGDTFAWLAEASPDTVVVYGTNLIREPLLSRWSGRMVNLHLGLSPYYRGTATNFYPLLNEEPEYVGATIHWIDAGIDSGPILRHARPDIVPDDMPHTIGCKAIVAGVDALVGALRDLDRGRRQTVPQWSVPNAKVYFRKDYHPRQVVELYRKLEAGMIRQYLERRARGEAEVRLVG